MNHGQNPRVTICLGIFGPECDPEEVARRVGIEPTPWSHLDRQSSETRKASWGANAWMIAVGVVRPSRSTTCFEHFVKKQMPLLRSFERSARS